LGIVAADLIPRELSPRGRKAGDARPAEIMSQAATAMGEVSTHDQLRDPFQRRTHKPVARCVQSELIEPARNFSTVEKTLREGTKQIDPTTHPGEHGFAMPIAAGRFRNRCSTLVPGVAL
jgi:hypothetical protein